MARRLAIPTGRALVPWLPRPGHQFNIIGAAAMIEVGAIADGIVVTVRPFPDSPRDCGIASNTLNTRPRSYVVQVNDNKQETDSPIGAAAQSASAEIDQLRADLAAIERRETRISAFGLPIIAAGIVLTGLPDEWVARPWFAAVSSRCPSSAQCRARA